MRVSDLGVTNGREFRQLSEGSAWIADGLSFRSLVDMEVQKARRLRYCVSLVCIATDPRQPETPLPATPSLAEVITPLIRSTDVVACWTLPSLASLLVNAEVTSLPSIVHRLMSRLETFVWSAGGACYPTNVTGSEELFQKALDLMLQARNDGGDRLYLPP